MAHEQLHRKEVEERSSDRSFGIVFCIALLVVGLLPLIASGRARVWSLALAAAMLLVAMVAPALLAWPNRLWTHLGMLLHKIVSPLVLGVMFFGVITPMGLAMRALGKDPLRLRTDPKVATYWVRRAPPGPAPDSFKHQF